MNKNEKLSEKESIQFYKDLIAKNDETSKEIIQFLESVIEKQKSLMYHYDRALGKSQKNKEIDQTDKQLDIDKAYLDHLKETQNIVIMRKSERGWNKYE